MPLAVHQQQRSSFYQQQRAAPLQQSRTSVQHQQLKQQQLTTMTTMNNKEIGKLGMAASVVATEQQPATYISPPTRHRLERLQQQQQPHDNMVR